MAMKSNFYHARPAATAIAAVLALSSTPLLAQDAQGGSALDIQPSAPQTTAAQPTAQPQTILPAESSPATPAPSTSPAPTSAPTRFDTATNTPLPQSAASQQNAQSPVVQQAPERIAVPEISAPEPEQPAARTAAPAAEPAPAPKPAPTPAPTVSAQTSDAAASGSADTADTATTDDAAGLDEYGTLPVPADTDAELAASPAFADAAPASEANSGSDLMYIAGAGAVGLGLIAFLLAMAARRRRRQPSTLRRKENVSSTDTIPMKPVMQPKAKAEATRPNVADATAGELAAKRNLSPEGNVTTADPVAARRRAAAAIDGGEGWKGGVQRSVIFGDGPARQVQGAERKDEPAFASHAPAQADVVEKRPAFAEPRWTDRADDDGETLVREPEVTQQVEAEPVVAEAAQPRPEPEVVAAATAPQLSGDPIAQAQTAEGRNALIDRMVAAEPDEAIPFQSPKARRRRARLIMQTMMQRLEDNPNLDFGRFYRGFGQQAGAGSPAIA